MEYTTRMGSGPGRAHVNYQCPCGCIGGVIYSTGKPLSRAGACCCGRLLWVGDGAAERLRPYLAAGTEYEWDLGTVTLPWGEVAATAMAWPKTSPGPAADDHDAPAPGTLVRDVVCGMMIDPEEAAATSEYRGATYYFCAPACKARFDADPRAFVRARKNLLDRLRRRP